MKTENLGALASLASSMTWAIGTTAFAVIAPRVEAYRIHFTRAFVALPFFILFFIFIEAPKFGGIDPSLSQLTGTKVLWLITSIFSSYALGDLFFLWALVRLGGSSALAISSCYPIWSALVGWLFQGESLSIVRILGLIAVLVGVIGVILLGKKDQDQAKDLSHYTQGVVFAFIASLLWALNTISVARGAHPDLPALSNSIRMGGSLVLCPLVSWVFLRKKVKSPLIEWTDLKRYGFVIWLESFGGSLLFIYGMSHAKLAVASALSSLAPALAYMLACLLGREKLEIKKAFFVCLVIAGIWGLMR